MRGSISAPGANSSGANPRKGIRMRNYEVAFIVQPDLEEGAYDEVLDKVKGWITKSGGKVLDVDVWGKRKMAYEIRKLTEGHYIIMQTEMEPEFTAELERNLNLQETVMRFMITVPAARKEASAE